MDALLLAFLGCLLCESGGAIQMLAAALEQRFARTGLVLLAIVLAATLNAVLAAWGGWFVSGLIASDARTLFLAIALLLGGAGLLIPVKSPDMLDGWRAGPFLTAFLGIAILGFGDGAQFLIMGIATRTADPVLAAAGGAAGVVAACVPAVILKKPPMSPGVSITLRRIGGVVLLIAGAVLGLSAIQLI